MESSQWKPGRYVHGRYSYRGGAVVWARLPMRAWPVRLRELWTVYSSELDLYDFSRAKSDHANYWSLYLGQQLEPGVSHQVDQLGFKYLCALSVLWQTHWQQWLVTACIERYACTYFHQLARELTTCTAYLGMICCILTQCVTFVSLVHTASPCKTTLHNYVNHQCSN